MVIEESKPCSLQAKPYYLLLVTFVWLTISPPNHLIGATLAALVTEFPLAADLFYIFKGRDSGGARFGRHSVSFIGCGFPVSI